MSTPFEEPTIHELVTRLAELERAHARLQEELTHVRAEQAQVAEEQTSTQTRTHPERSSRRKVLTTGLGVAAATVGVGTMLELSGGTALAKPPAPGVFASSVAGTPAVKATGTNGADGVDATSDSGTGVSAISVSGDGIFAKSGSADAIHAVGGAGRSGLFAEGGSGYGVFATSTNFPGVHGVSSSSTGVEGFSNSGNGVRGLSNTGLAGLFDGNVQVNGNFSATGTLNSGAGTFASSVSGTPSIKAAGTNGAYGVFASTDSGVGVQGSSSFGLGVFGSSDGAGSGVFGQSSSGKGTHGFSDSGVGVVGSSNTGLAGQFFGDVQVSGNFSAAGTKSFVQAHPTDPSREIVYVALEGGEAGTYVRGTGTLVNGKAVLALPEHFGLVTSYEDLTIQLSPRGEWLHLYLVELDATQAVVREAQGKSGAFDYLIHGVRKGYEQHEVLRTKR